MITLIEGTITTDDGVTRQFMIGPQGSSLWGADREKLADVVDVVTEWSDTLRQNGEIVDEFGIEESNSDRPARLDKEN